MSIDSRKIMLIGFIVFNENANLGGFPSKGKHATNCSRAV
jgi:hypothetical protein